MNTAKLFGFSTNNEKKQIHHYHPEYGYYTHTTTELIPKGMTPPANSTLVTPVFEDGKLPIFKRLKRKQWVNIPNPFEMLWYSKENGLPIEITDPLGNFKSGSTNIKPPVLKNDQFCTFINNTWIKCNNRQTIYNKGTGIGIVIEPNTVYDNEQYTSKPPLEFNDDYKVVFKNSGWVYVKEYKNSIFWDTETGEMVSYTGINPPSTYILKPDDLDYPSPYWNGSNWVNNDGFTITLLCNKFLHMSDRLIQIPDYEIDGELLTPEMKEELLKYRGELRTTRKQYKDIIEGVDYNPIPTPPKWVDFDTTHYYQKFD